MKQGKEPPITVGNTFDREKQMQRPLPPPIAPEVIAAQKALAQTGANPILWEVPELLLEFDESDNTCWLWDLQGHKCCRPGCVLVKSKALGNFLSTRLGWEHFPIRADGTAATPHYTPWASVVHLP